MAASDWLLGTLLGTAGTSIAIIAVAIVGYEAVLGHMSLRRVLRVILGCFIFFGAPMIVRGVMAASQGPVDTPVPPQPLAAAPAAPKVPQNYDPYAGATAPQ